MVRFTKASFGFLLVFAPYLTAPVSAHATAVFFVDSTGKVEEINPKKPGRHLQPTPNEPKAILRSGSTTWNISYQDVLLNTNQGFDHPTLGETRRMAVAQVLNYINDVIQSSTSATVDVVFDLSENDASGALASAGTYFSATPQFTNGFCFEHISTGVDPSGSLPDIFCTVDFGWPWYLGSGNPSPSELDFLTVMLHEMTHGLGFLSLANPDGSSMIAPGVYSVWDDLLYTGSGIDLFSWNGTTVVFNGNSVSLLGGQGGVFFRGTEATTTYGSYPPIYAPSSWQSGSSISHWRPDIVGGAVMVPALYYGSTVRNYAPVEYASLRDLGYGQAGEPTPDLPFVDIDSANFSVGEGHGTAVIPVSLTHAPGTGNSASVTYTITPGTASAGSDYIASNGVLTFGESETTKNINVTILEDGLIESDETIVITLSDPTACVLAGVNNPATLTIVDNDVDTDGDGISDHDEINFDDDPAYNPYHPITNPAGTDLDYTHPDTDGDGFSDSEELIRNTNPLDPTDFPVTSVRTLVVPLFKRALDR